jgi:hypothetical protein
MKPFTFVPIAILAMSVPAFGQTEKSEGYVAESIATSETFRTRILKVHQFVEGDFEYAAYSITWRGHEVVVPALLGDPILKEGDEIRCVMRSSPSKVGGDQKTSISFAIVSSRASGNDEARLRAVAAEVNRRRAERASQNKDEPVSEK